MNFLHFVFLGGFDWKCSTEFFEIIWFKHAHQLIHIINFPFGSPVEALPLKMTTPMFVEGATLTWETVRDRFATAVGNLFKSRIKSTCTDSSCGDGTLGAMCNNCSLEAEKFLLSMDIAIVNYEIQQLKSINDGHFLKFRELSKPSISKPPIATVPSPTAQPRLEQDPDRSTANLAKAQKSMPSSSTTPLPKNDIVYARILDRKRTPWAVVPPCVTRRCEEFLEGSKTRLRESGLDADFLDELTPEDVFRNGIPIPDDDRKGICASLDALLVIGISNSLRPDRIRLPGVDYIPPTPALTPGVTPWEEVPKKIKDYLAALLEELKAEIIAEMIAEGLKREFIQNPIDILEKLTPEEMFMNGVPVPNDWRGRLCVVANGRIGVLDKVDNALPMGRRSLLNARGGNHYWLEKKRSHDQELDNTSFPTTVDTSPSKTTNDPVSLVASHG